jgi:RNA polymerase sigma factor (sigma-70 family)
MNKDNLLWGRFRNGEADAYTELMQLYINRMFRYGMRLSADEDLVKDCIQDVFFELWNRRERIKDTPSVNAYLFKSLRLRIHRERPKWNYAESLDDNYHFTVEYTIETKLIEEQSLREEHIKLENILNSLPKRQKEILYLRFYENLDQAQIAEVMGLNRQSVYNLMNHTLAVLRQVWFKDVALLLVILSSSIKN